ncbi:MazG nucleotide pyrophosphohydrolase domain-containing protein [Thermoactinospora rubra]|uniref:MazG nucleotide pyrophosphohydrolase domain-containing protein n=1 Tax=Thermoactinospora rubra TaxID=1088767 RepID=UPI000A119313|nr:MazG nucleotide pyrophosphohydrolase domain-containing protein [Thermoactinospora rubra]
MLDPMEALARWHAATDDGSPVDLRLRLALIEEECAEVRSELLAAIEGRGSLPRLAKELADLLYVVYGTADRLGIPLDRVFQLVHEANMRKVDPRTGRVERRADGKVLKPEGFRDVSLEEIEAVVRAARP